MYVHGEDEREGKLTLRNVLEWRRGAESQEWLEGGAFVRRVGLSRGKGEKAEWAPGGCEGAHGSRPLPASCVRVQEGNQNLVLRSHGSFQRKPSGSLSRSLPF